MKKITLIAALLISLVASAQYTRVSAQLKQLNNQDFPLLDSQHLLGGAMTGNDRTSVPLGSRVNGMLYIDSDDAVIYQLINESWSQLQFGSSAPANELLFGTGIGTTSSANLTYDGTDLIFGSMNRIGMGGPPTADHSIFLHDGHFATWYSIGVGDEADRTFEWMLKVVGDVDFSGANRIRTGPNYRLQRTDGDNT